MTPTPTFTPTPTPTGHVRFGAWVGSASNVAGDEAGFEQAAGKPRSVRHWYWSVDPLNGDAANFAAWSTTMAPGEILMLSWAPSATDSSLDNVNNGVHDAYVTAWAQALRDYHGEVWLRPMWEDNGTWFWWKSGFASDTTTKNKYKTAFQRIVTIFRNQGATNVKFVWSPYVRAPGWGPGLPSYPGDSYVDWIGLDGFPYRSGAGSFASVFGPDYTELGALGKPLMVAETSISVSADVDRASYLTDLLGSVLPTQFPNFTALIWFSEPDWGDLLDSSYPVTRAAFQQGIGSSYYIGR
jgi:endoglucanase